MEEVEAISSRVAIMDAGRVIAQGSVDELVGRMAHEDTVRFTALQSTQALIENLEAVHGVKSVNVNGNAFQVISSANSGNMNRIMEIVTQHGGATTFSQGSSNLEDVFLTLTGKKLRDSEA
jgi:ABC-2 type transport system ATP-binding protein